jgi:hypothetical protein
MQYFLHPMPAPSLLSPDQWREIKTVAETGMPLPEVARKFDVSYDMVRKRAHRESWLTLARVESLREKQIKVSSSSRIVPRASEVVASTLEERQNHHREKMHKITSLLTDKAVEAVEEGRLAVTDLSELEKLQKMARLNLDMSTGETGPGVQILFTGSEPSQAQVIDTDADVIDCEDVEDLPDEQGESWV